MKKWIMMLCVGILALGLTACGNRKDADTGSESGGSSLQESMGVQGNVGAGESTVEDIGPGGAGEDVGEDAGGWSEEMQSLRDAVAAELGDDYWPNMEMPAEILKSQYGLTEDMYEDYMGEMPMMSAHVDTLLIVKAKEGQADEVKGILEDYRINLLKDSMQYPMNMGKVQASKVDSEGDYVYFVLLGGDVTEVAEKGDEAVIAYCREQNERVIDILVQQVA
ncbi:MAG: DUF4358 domain-containing protein [Acetatifactor sp.]|nr:DUF4358 domain-containing protein [Acetatifactor sp.]